MAANPLHAESGPDTTWTTVNFGEANPGVQTPLGMTFWLDASEASLVAIGGALGAFSRSEARVSEHVDRRHMAAFHARMAGNVNRFRELADRLPGTSGDAFEEQVLGAVQSGARNHPLRRRYPITAVKMPLAAWRASHEVIRARRESETWWRLASRAPGDEHRRAIATYAEAYWRFARLMYVHGLITLLAQACFEQVAALAAAAGMAGAHAELITGYGGLEETRLLRDLWAVARDGASLTAFVEAYGYHGPASGDLSSPSWREDAAPLDAQLAAYRSMPESDAPLARQRRQAEIRIATERSLLDATGSARRAAARLLLRLTARFVSQREVGKTAYLQILDAARASARTAGRELVAGGVLERPDDVFFLTTTELTDGVPIDARELIAERCRFFGECTRVRLPDTWRGMPAAIPIDSPGPTPRLAGPLTGIGVAPGVVTGRVCVVTDPLDAAQLRDGDILVCETTNPSWVVLFLTARALVIDVGGALSHGAIAARELGIPCVINTREGTRLLRTGELVTVDGTRGVVEPAGPEEPHTTHHNQPEEERHEPARR